MFLSGSVALRRALRTPFSIQARWVRARSSSPAPGPGVLVVLIARVPPGHLALGQVGGVAAAVGGHLLLGQVQLDDPGDRPGQELPVVADQDGAAAPPGDERLQPGQAVQVQVVGRLVQQGDVVPAEQQRGQAGPGRLAAGQARSSGGPSSGGPGGSRPSAAAPPRPARPGPRRPARASGPARGSRRRRRRGRRRPGRRRRPACASPAAATPVRRARNWADGLAGAAVGLLGQVADGGAGRGQQDLPVAGHARVLLAGQQPQQGGLAGAVGADQADRVARADDQVKPGEQEAVAVRGGQAAGDEGSSLGSSGRSGHPGHRAVIGCQNSQAKPATARSSTSSR